MRVVAIATLLLVACCSPPKPPRNTIPYDAATCEQACENARAMHCAVGDPTPKTKASCEAVCHNAIDHGNPYPAGCIAAATTCEAADAC